PNGWSVMVHIPPASLASGPASGTEPPVPAPPVPAVVLLLLADVTAELLAGPPAAPPEPVAVALLRDTDPAQLARTMKTDVSAISDPTRRLMVALLRVEGPHHTPAGGARASDARALRGYTCCCPSSCRSSIRCRRCTSPRPSGRRCRSSDSCSGW